MKNLLLILVSLFLSLFIAESLSRIFFMNKNSNLFLKILTILQNIIQIKKFYQKHIIIRMTTL